MAHTILVVDGEPVQLNTLCAVLKERLAYQATGVADGREATRYVMTEQMPKPDLVLFDMSMGTDGCGAIRSLRTLIVQTPIIVLVKYGDYVTATAALECGAQDYLTKPVAAERLGTTLRNVLRLRDAQREAAYLRHGQIHEIHANGQATEVLRGTQPVSVIAEDGNVRRMEQIEAEIIRFAMQHYKGRMTEVARRLGIGRSTLYRKLSELGVRVKQQEAA